MKWFVYVGAEYYAETHIVEADTPETAAELALAQTGGATYARYAGESDENATPAIAVMLFADVVFIGSKDRVARLREDDDQADQVPL